VARDDNKDDPFILLQLPKLSINLNEIQRTEDRKSLVTVKVRWFCVAVVSMK